MTLRIDQKASQFGLALLLLIAMSFALPACNTVEGAGKDIEAAGGAISDTAEDTKEELSD